MQLIIISFLIVFAVFSLLMLVINGLSHTRLTLEQRINSYILQQKPENVIEEELSVPLQERLTRPLRRLSRALPERALNAVTLEGLSTKLMLAGYPGNLSASEFIALRYSLMVVLPVIVLVVSLFSGITIVNTTMLLVFAGVLGYFTPDILLRFKRISRQEEIRKQLPDVLDLLTVSVEAGLGFDASVSKVVEQMEGPLPQELRRYLQETKMGKPRREALKDLNDRVGVENVSSFITAVLQADQLGVAIGKVLRLQARDSREKRRRQAQEQAMKAPVKMIFPLVLFIFPAIFIVLLGPAVIKIIDTLMNM